MRMGKAAFAALLWLCVCDVLLGSSAIQAQAQRSVARRWNEALLEAIRNDYARPTVHARNLFHLSVVLYDAWAVYDDVAVPYLLGHRIGSYACGFAGVEKVADVEAVRAEAMSYAAYRLLVHRFSASPEARGSLNSFRTLMTELGYNPAFTSVDYRSGSPAALGNYIARCAIDFGLQDGSNELNGYASPLYRVVNPPLRPTEPGNPTLRDANRWQSLSLQVFIDQSGHQLPGGTPPFITPEWGRVTPFALGEAERSVRERDGHVYWVYRDPGPPPYTAEDGSGTAGDYAWNFALVAVWSAHLDPDDGVLFDISPGAIGGIDTWLQTPEALRTFYSLFKGGDQSRGHVRNPHSGLPYEPQRVPRGDYARVLAEFWADGPNSETPPGHWFVLLNYVNDQPELERRMRGDGPLLNALEWDVKAYMALGGAMHDAAIAAWSIKGWYDYIRPISAIRAMADRGQRSDPQQPHYAADGIPLYPDFIELIGAGDELAGVAGEHIGKIKLRAWRGPNSVDNPREDAAGVGWIRAEEWWPYQRPSFVTPPFAGYVSGHSTYSRAAAEVLTLLTGDAYFPGGIARFLARRDEFLTFERGPSVDVELQWATYRDAADQCSLSRIWGGIHPPADDMPGRLLGLEIGQRAFAQAERYFVGQVDYRPAQTSASHIVVRTYPNPLRQGRALRVLFDRAVVDEFFDVSLYDVLGQMVYRRTVDRRQTAIQLEPSLAAGVYLLRVQGGDWQARAKVVVVE